MSKHNIREDYTFPIDRDGKTIGLTYKQVRIKKFIKRYTQEMMRTIKATGKEPFVLLEGGVVVEEKWGGGVFPSKEAAYESITLFLFYPECYHEMRKLGA